MLVEAAATTLTPPGVFTGALLPSGPFSPSAGAREEGLGRASATEPGPHTWASRPTVGTQAALLRGSIAALQGLEAV